MRFELGFARTAGTFAGHQPFFWRDRDGTAPVDCLHLVEIHLLPAARYGRPLMLRAGGRSGKPDWHDESSAIVVAMSSRIHAQCYLRAGDRAACSLSDTLRREMIGNVGTSEEDE